MSHADLNRRIDEVLGRDINAPNLVSRLNRTLASAGVPDRVDTLSNDEINSLSQDAVSAALQHLTHDTYDRPTDVERAKRVVTRKAS